MSGSGVPPYAKTDESFMSDTANRQSITQSLSDVDGNKAVSYLFWAAGLFGFCGLHRLYNGKVTSGVIWFCTLGLFGIGQVVDLAFVGRMSDERSRRSNRPLAGTAQVPTAGLTHSADQAAP